MRKRIISCLLILLMPLSLSACGEAVESEQGSQGSMSEETGYILSHYQKLPESVTHISRCFLEGDKIYLCCWEEADPENAAYYAATIYIDGSGFQKLSLEHTDEAIMLDIAPDGQGGLWCLFLTSGGEETSSYTLCGFDSKGRLTLEKPLNAFLEEAGALRYAGRDVYLTADGEGNLCVTVKSSKTYCFLFDRDGNALFSLYDNWYTFSAITTADGQFLACITTGSEDYYLLPIDMETRNWDYSKRVSLGTVSNVFSGANDACYYLYDASGFYSGDFESGRKVQLFNWSNLGLANGDSHICPLSDGRFAVVAGISNQMGTISYEFCIVEPGEDQRTVLTMFSVQPDNSLLEAVALFNKSNDAYKVELTSTFSLGDQSVSADDWNNAVTNFNTRLMAGDVPDLIDLNNLAVERYAIAGYLEDLYPYLENDPTIDLDDYFDNVFTALSIRGELPYITSSVYILTMFADANVVGNARSWTVDEYIALKNSGRIITSGLEPSQFLEMLLTADTRFVNWQTGECSFDSDAFIDLLELCKSMADSEMTGQIVPEGSQANCRYANIISVMDTAWFNSLFGGNASPIGFPNTGEGALHALRPANKIGISTACQYKDGAWAFVRSFLEPTLQESGWYFPYLKSSFEKIASAAMDGNIMWTGGGHDTEITKADIELTREILSSAEYSTNGDEGLIEVVLTQAEDYFTGTKTAQETAAAIQSRAELYVGERM